MTAHERKQAIEYWLTCKNNVGYFDKDVARITNSIRAAQVYSAIRFVFKCTIWTECTDEVMSNDGWFYLYSECVCNICEIAPSDLSNYIKTLIKNNLLERKTKHLGYGKGTISYYRFPIAVIEAGGKFLDAPGTGYQAKRNRKNKATESKELLGKNKVKKSTDRTDCTLCESQSVSGVTLCESQSVSGVTLCESQSVSGVTLCGSQSVSGVTLCGSQSVNEKIDCHGTVETPGLEGFSTRARLPYSKKIYNNIYGCGDACIGESGPSAPHPNRIPTSVRTEKNTNTNTSGCAGACIGESEPAAPHPNRASASVRAFMERNHTETKTSNCFSTETSNYGAPNGSKDPLGRPCESQESVKHGSSTLDFVDPAPRSKDSRGVSCNPSKLLEVPNYSKLDYLCAQLCFNRVCANFPKSNASKDGWENVKHDWSVTISKLAKKFTNGDDELVRNALTWAFGPRSRQNGFLQDNIRSLPMLLTKKWNAGGEKEFTFDRLLRDYSSETQPVREDSVDDKLRSACSKALAQYDDTDGVDEECVMSYVEYIQEEVDRLNKILPPEKRGNWHRTNKIAQIIPWLTDIIVCYHGDSTYPDVTSYLRRFFQRTEFKIREGALHYFWPGYFSDDCNVYSEFETEICSSHPNLFN